MATRNSAAKKSGDVAVIDQPKPGTALVNIEAELMKEITEIAERVSAPTGSRIYCTQDKKFAMPDKTEHPGPLSAVILDFVFANAFYEGAFVKGEVSTPACFAIATKAADLAPSPNAPNKQHDTCKGCPNDEWGSGVGKGKACKNSIKVALLSPDATDDSPIMILQTSPTAIKPFEGYVNKLLTQMKTPLLKVVTDIYFDPSSSFASLRFGNPRPVSEELLAMAFARRAEARTMLLAEPDASGYEAPKPKVAQAGQRRR